MVGRQLATFASLFALILVSSYVYTVYWQPRFIAV
jgi:hypothetical protein